LRSGRRIARSASGQDSGNLWEVEQPLGVGLGIAHAPAQLRQAGSHQHHRQLLLLDAVHGRDQSRQLILLDVLQLVDEDGHGGAGGLRSQTDLLEERLQVGRPAREEDCRRLGKRGCEWSP